MIIKKTKVYEKSYKKLILDKHLTNEIERIRNIENIIISSKNLEDLVLNPYKEIYHIEQKKGALKEFYTARINDKIRLIMKPLGTYPYNRIEITEIEFLNIDNKHYGEG